MPRLGGLPGVPMHAVHRAGGQQYAGAAGPHCLRPPPHTGYSAARHRSTISLATVIAVVDLTMASAAHLFSWHTTPAQQHAPSYKNSQSQQMQLFGGNGSAPAIPHDTAAEIYTEQQPQNDIAQ